MKSTGEVMGFDPDFGTAFAKSQAAAFGSLPTSGKVFVCGGQPRQALDDLPVQVLAELGFEILATQGTAEVLRRNGVASTIVRKHFEGEGPHGEQTTVQLIHDGEIQLDRQHALRRRAAAARRASTATRSAPRRSAPTSPASPPSRVWAPRCRASRRCAAATSASAACRSGPCGTAAEVSARDVLFDRVATRIDPERAHHLGFRAVRAAQPVLPGGVRRASPVHAMGLTFPNVLGLAAGFDKNAVGIDALAALGFGHVEVGTVTGHGQPGNPQPRLFRLTHDRAVVNRMGFNNDGAAAVAHRLAARAEVSRWSGGGRRAREGDGRGVFGGRGSPS